jgi:hypothetical protein
MYTIVVIGCTLPYCNLVRHQNDMAWRIKLMTVYNCSGILFLVYKGSLSEQMRGVVHT